MASLSVRNVPPHVLAVLRLRAARAGHSMEAEVRALLLRVAEGDREGGEDLRGAGREILARAGRSDSVDSFLADRRRDSGED